MQRNIPNLIKLILLIGLMFLDIFLQDLGIENERFRDVLDKAIQYGMVVLFLQLLLAMVKWN